MELIDIPFVLLLISLATAQSLLTRYYSTTYPGHESTSSPVFTVVSGLIVALISMSFAGFQLSASWPTVLLGVINALALVLFNTCLINASNHGPYSITVVSMIAGGIVIPSVAAAFYQPGDAGRLSAVKIVSILVILASVYLVSKKGGETYKNKKLFWLSCIGLAIGNGIYGIIVDYQQVLTGIEEKEELIAISYFLSALFSAVILLAKERKKTFAAFRQSKKSLVFMLGASVVVALSINSMAYVLAKDLIDLSILYTIDNSSVFLLSVLFSCIFLKEKLSRLNIVGCVTLCTALVCMSLSNQISDLIASGWATLVGIWA